MLLNFLEMKGRENVLTFSLNGGLALENIQINLRIVPRCVDSQLICECALGHYPDNNYFFCEHFFFLNWNAV